MLLPLTPNSSLQNKGTRPCGEKPPGRLAAAPAPPLTRHPGMEVLLHAELRRGGGSGGSGGLQRCQGGPAQRAVENRQDLAGEGVEILPDLHVGLEERQGVDDHGVVGLLVRLPQDAQDVLPVVLQHVGLEDLPDQVHLIRAQRHVAPARRAGGRVGEGKESRYRSRAFR